MRNAVELFPRACSCCGRGMDEGFILGDGERYACSEACLYVDGYTHEEYLEDVADDYAFWTVWDLEEGDGYAYTAAGVEVSL